MMGNITPAPKLPATLTSDEWRARFDRFNRQVYTSYLFDFDTVTRHVYRPPDGFILADHCVVRDGDTWHLFYATGDHKNCDVWMAALRAGDWKRCRELPYEMGDGHAVGPRLDRLDFREIILREPQGDWGLVGQITSNIIRVGEGWANIYTGRGPPGQCLCLARSADLERWELDPRNPIWRPPEYARPATCKNASIIRHPETGRYLVYYCLALKSGPCAVALLSTEDFETFADHGPVYQMPYQLRGTGGIEAPCVVHRDGMWHLFTGNGPGVWHTVSPRPDDFMSVGSYCLGPFHAVEVFENAGRWYMTGTAKEHLREQNRKAGRDVFRGTSADEGLTLPGLFLSAVEWRGDQPLLRKPGADEVP